MKPPDFWTINSIIDMKNGLLQEPWKNQCFQPPRSDEKAPSPHVTALRLDDMGWAEAKKAPKRRVSLKRNLRNWFFERLGQWKNSAEEVRQFGGDDE